jgi:hypothetical protein
MVENKSYVHVESKSSYDVNETINLPEIKRLASTNNDVKFSLFFFSLIYFFF